MSQTGHSLQRTLTLPSTTCSLWEVTTLVNGTSIYTAAVIRNLGVILDTSFSSLTSSSFTNIDDSTSRIYLPFITFYLLFHNSSPSYGEGNGTPLQYSCLENPIDGGAWKAAVHGVAKSWTRLINFTFTFHFHALEKEMATHSSVLAWRIPGTGECGGLPSMGSHRVGHD